MKNFIILLFLSFISISVFPQVNGIDFKTAIKINDNDEVIYEKLTIVDNGYVIPYKLNPVGIKHCVEKFNEIMVNNNLTYDNIYHNDMLLASYVDNITDYSSLSTSLIAGSSEITLSWEINEWFIVLVMND